MYNKAKQHRALRALDLATLGRCWQRYAKKENKMPHCVIEHSINLDSDLLVEQVFQGALSSGLFEPDGSDIKVRAQGYSSYMTGPKKQTSFMWL